MRCTRHAALDCRQPEACEILGCHAGAAQVVAPAAPAAVALGPIERAMVRLHDRIEALGRKPARELPPLPSLSMDEVMSEIRTMLPDPAPAPVAPPGPPPAPPAAPPAAPAPARSAPQRQAAREVKIVAVAHGGWVFVEQNAPVAVALDPVGAGQTLAALLGS